MKTLFENFTNQYPVSKTLRFELIPQGKTKEFIEQKGLLKQDEDRAEKYKKVKKTIDEYHKDFIEKSLSGVKLKGLSVYMDLYLKPNKEDKDKKAFDREKELLRKQIANAFKNHAKFKTLFAKELIRQDLISFASAEDKKNVEAFQTFTTYFTGFHQNRKNMYVSDGKATSIAFRLINENLPKFIDNIKIFEKIKSDAPELISSLHNVLNDMKEIIKGRTLEELFALEYFNETLTQKGIDIYNAIIGGRTAEGRKKIKGLNEYINTDYNQKQTDKKKRQPKFKQLYKQILSDRQSLSFIAEAFNNDDDVLNAIEKFYANELLNFTQEGKSINVLEAIKNAVCGLDSFNLSKIYFRSGIPLTDVSQKAFEDWSLIKRALENYYERTYPIKTREKTEKYEERKEKWLKQDFDIDLIQAAIDGYDDEKIKEKNNGKVITSYLAGFCDEKGTDFNQKVNLSYAEVKDLLHNRPYPEKEKLGSNKKQVSQIKAFLDSIMEIMHFVKPLSMKDSDKEKDEIFYSLFAPLFDQLTLVIPLYNKVRNYLTQKPYSTEKIKLNFENSTLLNGWDLNKEADNTAIILRKNNLYYLGIMDKRNNKVFRRIPEVDKKDSCYEKMVYKQLPLVNQQLPRVFFSKSRIQEFSPSVKLLEHYEEGTHTKGDNFNMNHCHMLIDFFKASINKHEDWKNFDFRFSPTSFYKDLSGFYREVEHQGYKIRFQKVTDAFIDGLVNDGKLYLFQIYNKDFSPYSKGKPNLHTLYWKMLFDENNLKDVVYKLNGEAEVFWRKKSIAEKHNTIHKANESITNKNPDNPKATSKFDYDIIKDKRYTLDKFQFHVPITMNFKAVGVFNMNQGVNTFLKDNPDVNIIGIDRGERHLLYYTLINQKGEILKQESLNIIANEKQKVDYHNLLDQKEGDRATARQQWGVIENIKELKEGYLSQVIHKLTDLMIENNAIIVMEDLNFGFKRGRQKVEKQVYQKFEKMLIDKLNYLVDKNKKINEPGGLLNAYQLTDKYEDFMKYGKKQCGFLFYVPAWNTSKTDPATGFADLLYPHYETVDKSQKYFGKFEAIRFNRQANYFEFKIKHYDAFNPKAEDTKQDWTICTYGLRLDTYRNPKKNNNWDTQEVDLTKELQNLMQSQGIQFIDGKCIKEEICRQSDSQFFKRLMKLLRLTLQIRNSRVNSDEDWIISPIRVQGKIFDSREADESMPQNADANGAYHIALKGLWCLRQIREAKDLKKVNLAISNKEWLQFVQDRPFAK